MFWNDFLLLFILQGYSKALWQGQLPWRLWYNFCKYRYIIFKYFVKMLRMVTFVFFLLNHTKFFMLMMLVCLCLLQDALSAMTGVAHHINEMKRQHEQAVHVQVKKLHFLMLTFPRLINRPFPSCSKPLFQSRRGSSINTDRFPKQGAERASF